MKAKTTDIMIDIETLGTKTNASIIAIAMVEFDRNYGSVKNYQVININKDDWFKNERTADADTLLWWEKQAFNLSHIVEQKENVEWMDLQWALRYLTVFYKDASDNADNVTVWFNGASFDGAILKSAYEQFGWTVPWKYWQVNDVRTISALIPFYKDMVTSQPKWQKHNPYDDCLMQIGYLVQTLNTLETKAITSTYQELCDIYKNKIDSEHCVGFFDDNGKLICYMYLDEKGNAKMYHSLFHVDDMADEGSFDITFKVCKILTLNEMTEKRLDDIRKHLDEVKSVSDNVQSIIGKIENDGGLLISFLNGKPQYLVGASSTDEDYYWLTIVLDKNNKPKIEYSSCVGGYEIVTDKSLIRRIRECFENDKYQMEDFVKKTVSESGHDVLFAINVGDF